jgi:hypothetical protein
VTEDTSLFYARRASCTAVYTSGRSTCDASETHIAPAYYSARRHTWLASATLRPHRAIHRRQLIFSPPRIKFLAILFNASLLRKAHSRRTCFNPQSRVLTCVMRRRSGCVKTGALVSQLGGLVLERNLSCLLCYDCCGLRQCVAGANIQ